MKYTIHWIEHIIPDRYCDELDICYMEVDEEDNKENYDKVLKAILDDLPPKSKHTGGYYDVWEFECQDTFEANSIEEAKEITKEYECGQNNIFLVKDENDKRVFTEEDVCYE